MVQKSVLYEISDYIDIFSATPHLTLNKRRTLSSTFGGSLTICVAIVILYQTISQVVNMLQYQDPQIYQTTELEDVPSSTIMGPENNFFMAVLIQMGSNYINISQASLFRFPTNYIRVRKEGGTVTQNSFPILFSPCNQSDFPDSLYGEGTYMASGLNLAYCAYGINFTDSTTGKCSSDISQEKYPDCVTPPKFELQGNANTAKYDYIQTNLYACDTTDPTMPGLTCTTQNLTKLFNANRINVDLYFGNNAVISQNYKTPNLTFVDLVFWAITKGIQKTANVYVDKVIVQDFDDFVWDGAAKNRSYFIVNSAGMRESEKLGSTSPVFVQWNIKRSNKNIIINRDYAKITDILSDLGGFSKAAMFFAAFLAIGYIRFKYHIKIANGIYDFYMPDDDSKATGNRNNKLPKAEKSMFEQSQGLAMIDFSDSKMLKKDMSILSPKSPGAGLPEFENTNKPIQDYFKDLQMRKPLGNNLWHYCKYIFSFVSCKKPTHEAELTAKARTIAMNDLDLTRLVKKLGEVDMLKGLFLNLVQKDAFEFLPRPLVTQANERPLRLDSLQVSTLTGKLTIKPNEPSTASCPGSPGSPGLRSPYNGKLKKKTSMAELVSREEFSSLSKYGKLYMAYRYLIEDEDLSNFKLNKKLMASLDPNLLKMFRRVDEILGDEYTVRDFEDVVNEALRASAQNN